VKEEGGKMEKVALEEQKVGWNEVAVRQGQAFWRV
jgi:hypothetical protein